MTSTTNALSEADPAARHQYRLTVGSPVFYVADPWQDWKRHFAQLRDNRMVKLWGGGRPVVLTMCGLLGQTGTVVRHAEDCVDCRQARADEQAAAVAGNTAYAKAKLPGAEPVGARSRR